MISLCNLHLTDYCIILFQIIMTLFFQKLLKLQENGDNGQELNLLKKILWNLIIDSNNQNQTIDSKLNINRNNLRRLLHQSTFSKVWKKCSNLLPWFENLPVAKYLLAHKISYIFYEKNSNLLYISNCIEVYNYKIQIV